MNFTTANSMVKIKIERNDTIKTVLELENKIAKLEMVIKYRLLKHNSIYIEILDKINDIEKNQLYEYSLYREDQVTKLTNDINQMNYGIADIKKEINELKTNYNKMINRVLELDKSIPDYRLITNVKIAPLPEHQKNKCIP